MAYRQSGLRFCLPGELAAALMPGRNGAGRERAIAIGLAGGCRCQREFILPLLKAIRIPVTLFLNPNRLGEEGMMTAEDLRVAVREGVHLGGLWESSTPLESLGTPDAAWNLELYFHALRAHLPAPEQKNPELWLALSAEKGDERTVTLARAAGFSGVAGSVKTSRPHHLSLEPLVTPPASRRWWAPAKREFQGVCPAGR
jgi:hypothetical protein